MNISKPLPTNPNGNYCNAQWIKIIKHTIETNREVVETKKGLIDVLA